MHKLGLKLWSINLNYISEVDRLYSEGFCNYVELFSVPDSYDDVIEKWIALKVPYIIHAPHYATGLNFAKKEFFNKNSKLVLQALKFADKLNAENIIFHPGVDGDIKHTVEQLNNIKDPRMIIENKPYYAIDSDLICNGNSPQDIEFIIKETNIGFCFDIGHAICSANAKKINSFEYLNEFKKLKPRMFHISDGDVAGVYDRHLHFGHGSYDLKRILGLIPDNSLISIETEKSFKDSLRDFKDDVGFLKKLIEK